MLGGFFCLILAMGINESDFKAIELLFTYIVKSRVWPVQKYDPLEENRPNIMIAKGLTYRDAGFCSEVYVNLQKLTDWQRKHFSSRAQKIMPNRWYIEDINNITRIGFR